MTNLIKWEQIKYQHNSKLSDGEATIESVMTQALGEPVKLSSGEWNHIKFRTLHRDRAMWSSEDYHFIGIQMSVEWGYRMGEKVILRVMIKDGMIDLDILKEKYLKLKVTADGIEKQRTERAIYFQSQKDFYNKVIKEIGYTSPDFDAPLTNRIDIAEGTINSLTISGFINARQHANIEKLLGETMVHIELQNMSEDKIKILFAIFKGENPEY